MLFKWWKFFDLCSALIDWGKLNLRYNILYCWKHHIFEYLDQCDKKCWVSRAADDVLSKQSISVVIRTIVTFGIFKLFSNNSKTLMIKLILKEKFIDELRYLSYSSNLEKPFFNDFQKKKKKKYILSLLIIVTTHIVTPFSLTKMWLLLVGTVISCLSKKRKFFLDTTEIIVISY